MECYVYWIKRKEHTDPYSQGYVGISNDPQRRFVEHTLSDYKVGNAISKYNDIELVILHECLVREDALSLENKYRPEDYIGWNVICGGKEPPRNHLTEKTCKKISQTLKDRGCSPYCSKTHSKESIEKSNKTKRQLKYRWYHNPKTLECKSIATSIEPIPEGWKPGRKPKQIKEPKINIGNTKCWNVLSPNGETFQVKNLKQWCKQNNIPYLATFVGKPNGWKGWKCSKEYK